MFFSMGKKSPLAKGGVQSLWSLSKYFSRHFFMVNFILVIFSNSEISALGEPLKSVRNVRLQQQTQHVPAFLCSTGTTFNSFEAQ